MFFLLAWLSPLSLAAQSVAVTKSTSSIEGRQTTGYQVIVDAPAEEVRQSLAKYLKAMGRTKQSGDYITMAEPLIAGHKYAATLYATTRPDGSSTSAWLGMPLESGEDEASRDLEKLAYDFGVAFRRERIQLQIDESLRAVEAVEKQQTRLASQNRDLQTRIQNNKREKIELEKSLVNNAAELVDLTKRLEANDHARDSVATALLQIQKVVEMHRERQREVQ